MVVGLACAVVVAAFVRYALNLSHLRSLTKIPTVEPSGWPTVSVVMTARNEAATVRAALESRLADDYPAIEFIFVDDRSTDGTGALASAVAAGDPRFSLMRIDEVPSGWLGKVHALARGVERARGEWLLFSDADVSVAPDALRRAVSYALEHDIDLLALVPEYRTGSFAVDAAWAAFMRALALALDPAKVRDPRSEAAIGSGAFNLVRRSAYDRTPGFEHLRLETGDDAALGQMVKRAGGRIEMIDGRGCATVAVYRSISELVRGVEKNGSSMADRPFALVLLGMATWVAIEWTPPAVALAWALGHAPLWLGVFAAAATCLNTAAYVTALWTNTRTWAAGLAWPFGMATLAFAVTRSVYLTHRRGGVLWRDTFYPLDELHEGRRFNI